MRGSEPVVPVEGARVAVEDTRGGDPDNPPQWSFEMNDDLELPTCTYADGKWHRSYEGDPGGASGGPGAGFAAVWCCWPGSRSRSGRSRRRGVWRGRQG